MKPQQIVDRVGGGNVAATAKKLDCTRQAVYRWLKAGEMPELYVFRAKDILARSRKRR